MKKLLVFFFVVFVGVVMKGQQNSYPTTSGSNILLDGGYINLKIPQPTLTEWARGFYNISLDGSTRLGGVGLYHKDNIADYYFMAHGATPYKSGLGLYVGTNGSVSIGSTSSSLGRLVIQGENENLSNLVLNNDGPVPNNVKMQFYSANKEIGAITAYSSDNINSFLRFYTRNSNVLNERMRIIENGNVGIGATNPTLGKLQVNQSSNAPNQGVTVLSNNAGKSLRLWTDESKSYVYSGEIGNSDLILNNSGKVGIGVDSPEESLHCNGAAYFKKDIGGLKINNVINEIDNGYVRSSIISTRDGDLEWNSNSKRWTLGSGSSNDFTSILHTSNGELGFFTGKSNAFTSMNNTDFRDQFQRMTIDGDGKVGIGVRTPSEKLEVDGSIKVANEILGTTFTLDLDAGSTTYPKRITSEKVGGSATMEFQTYNNNLTDLSTKLLIRGGGSSDIEFYDRDQTEFVHFDGDTRRVGIGTAIPQSLLAVNGTITSKEVVVTETGWSDFVFQKDYNLKTLEQVETYIKANGHLPDVPSEKEVKENGLNLGESDAVLLQKIEELTLYAIEQNKEIKKLKKENAQNKNQKTEIESLKELVRVQMEAIEKLSEKVEEIGKLDKF